MSTSKKSEDSTRNEESISETEALPWKVERWSEDCYTNVCRSCDFAHEDPAVIKHHVTTVHGAQLP